MGLVNIGGVDIGDGCPVRVIAELGICHLGDVGLALELAEASAEGGADFIKTECWIAAESYGKFYHDDHYYDFGTLKDGVIHQNFWETRRDCELTYPEIERLKQRCDELGKPFFATAISRKDVDFLLDIGSCGIKLSSGEIDRLDLFEYVAEREVALFFDTAVTYLSEVLRAYETFRVAGGQTAVVFHNPQGYPAPPELVDLRRIAALKGLLDIPVGLACHSPGREATISAIALGADIVEKCIAPDNTGPYPEYATAENAAEFGDYVATIRRIEASLGEPNRIWTKEQWRAHQLGRQSPLAARPIKAGEAITEGDVLITYPGFGMRPYHADHIYGRRATRDLAEGEAIQWGDLGEKVGLDDD